MPTTEKCVIRGFGYYVPERVLTNQDLEAMVETSDEWITSRTGIRERRIAPEGAATSDLAAESVRRAAADAGIELNDITHLVLATLTPDSYVPPAACMLEYKLGINHKIPIDVNAACSGFTFALDVARGIIALNPKAVVAVTGAEILSTRTNWKDRSTCVLFGDGAGTTILTGETSSPAGGTILDIITTTDCTLHEHLAVIGGGSLKPYAMGEAVGEEYFIYMNGRAIYKHAVRNMEEITRRVLEKNGLTTDDVDIFVPHQANMRIISAVGDKLGFPPEKVFTNVDKYGNTSAASVPIALAEAYEQGRFPTGTTAVITTFGGGLTFGSSLVQF